MQRVLSLLRDQNQSFQTRLMRRITPFIVLGMMAAALVAVSFQRGLVQTRLQDIHRSGIRQAQQEIEKVFAPVFRDIRLIASDLETRRYGDETRQVVSDGGLSTQNSLLRTFFNLVSRNTNYLAARFITPAGAVWGTVTRRNAVLSVDENFYSGVFAANADLRRVLGFEADTVMLGSFKLLTDETNLPVSPLVPIISVYAPVASAQDSSRIVGVVQIDMESTPILEAVYLAMDNYIPREEARRLLLVD